MRANRILMALLAAAAIGAGCAPVGDEEDPNAVAADQSTEEARAAWTRFAGAWSGTGSAFSTLVFTNTTEDGGHHFFGEQQVTCVRAPCNPVRVEGSFTAGTRYLTLNVDGTATRYTYSLRGTSLTLTRGGRTVATLHKVDSYCRDAADAADVCAEQGLITPHCAPGRWTCSSDNLCGFACGAPTGDVGATCGGIAGLRCNDGLRCVITETHPDATGTCRAVSNEGGPCGGFTRFPAVCADGLTCTPPPAGGPSDQPGTCRRAGGSHGYGTMCGGIAGIRCDAGFRCVLTGSFPDASGYCHQESAEGGSCGGGSIRFPAVCADGLTCVPPAAGGPVGSSGTCRRPAACHATGCSSQICADHDVISTCEFRPEYACYRAATCERQADGNCGWTDTATLRACIAGGGTVEPFCPRVRCASGTTCCETARACIPMGALCPAR